MVLDTMLECSTAHFVHEKYHMDCAVITVEEPKCKNKVHIVKTGYTVVSIHKINAMCM